MTRWACAEPDEDGTPRIHRWTEAEILAAYWTYWCEEMRRVGKADRISEAACIEDWVIVHWAWRTYDP